MSANGSSIVVGILALQGAFVEHEAALRRLNLSKRLDIVLVRTPEELGRCHALVIPGGESTTIALLARLSGLLEPLRKFVVEKPVWGTCAGAILLAQTVENTKKGGQEVLGGMSISIARNGWGSQVSYYTYYILPDTYGSATQVESFEADLTVTGLTDPEIPFQGVFIRAPVVVELKPTPTDPPIQVVASLSPSLLPPALASPDHSNEPKIFVALRQGNHFLTTFHPELTQDDRFHDYFIRECVISQVANGNASPQS
ncbi:hypothetical protein EST38_g3237 [Candolleomyces aberdarensis]|uniref:glutaminase n=1 Tax=Candolleomyces aberdarensis TaxID=2316362 RepID=A0A4Q2DR97_9AGAR|nr:hypothetical protein EST38_g3237 [Candolleomyces aberdarensis]